jgi:hypothetical protein
MSLRIATAIALIIVSNGCMSATVSGDVSNDTACASLIVEKMENLYLPKNFRIVFLKLDSEAVEQAMKERRQNDNQMVEIVMVKPNTDLSSLSYEGRGIYVTARRESATFAERVYVVGAFHGAMSGYFWTIKCRQREGVWYIADMEAGPIV